MRIVKYSVFLALVLFCRPAAAEVEFVGGYDYYVEPHHHNYEDAQGFTLGLEHPISGHLKGQVLYKHVLGVDFPAVQDPKGSWGEMRGDIAMYALKYDMPYNDKIGFYISAGAGYGFWDFRENPFLQDAAVTVELDNSLVVELGIGVDINAGRDWHITAETGWFDTNIGKDISENDAGIVNILDSGDIGLQYIPVRVGIRKRF